MLLKITATSAAVSSVNSVDREPCFDWTRRFEHKGVSIYKSNIRGLVGGRTRTDTKSDGFQMGMESGSTATGHHNTGCEDCDQTTSHKNRRLTGEEAVRVHLKMRGAELTLHISWPTPSRLVALVQCLVVLAELLTYYVNPK